MSTSTLPARFHHRGHLRAHEAPLQAGRFLAQEHPVEADVVIGAPDSGLDAALGYAQESGIPYGIGFIKNKYVGRTFIQASQAQRESSVRIKLNAISATVKGKRVVLVDDSIVRGTTSARTIRLLREAGAKRGTLPHQRPAVRPPLLLRHRHSRRKDLIATGHTVEEINEMVGSDTLGYLSIEHVQQLASTASCGYCTGCFTGKYPVNPPTETMEIIYDKPLSVSNPNKNCNRRGAFPMRPQTASHLRADIESASTEYFSQGEILLLWKKSYSASYAAAGVDITAGYRSVELMKQYVARTMTENCIGGLGGFGGLFELDCTGMEHPVLISGTDGVGTKLRIAMLLDKHDTIGIDCVAMCVNDVSSAPVQSRWFSWITLPAARTSLRRLPRSSRAWPRAACRRAALWWAARLPSIPA